MSSSKVLFVKRFDKTIKEQALVHVGLIVLNIDDPNKFTSGEVWRTLRPIIAIFHPMVVNDTYSPTDP